jgi:DNA-binding MarR family transcriptional regulator
MANEFSVQIAPNFEERYPSASPKATECAMNLVFSADLMVKNISSMLQPFDLSPASGLVLSIVADSAEPLPPNKLAERLIISRATVTGLIDSLERRGYVQRTSHPSDRRMLLIVPTERGKEVANAFRPIVHRQEKQWMETLSEEEQRSLIDIFHRLQAVLAGSND